MGIRGQRSEICIDFHKISCYTTTNYRGLATGGHGEMIRPHCPCGSGAVQRCRSGAVARLSRRDFVKQSVAATAAAHFGAVANHAQTTTNPAPQPPRLKPGDGVELRWLEHSTRHPSGVTFGVPWPRDTFKPDQVFAVQASSGAAVDSQSWPLASWPDGSLKWTAHALPPIAEASEKLILKPAPAAAVAANTVSVQQHDDA